MLRRGADTVYMIRTLPEKVYRYRPRYAHEARALVAEIRRLSPIPECANDLVRALASARLTTTPQLLLAALVERAEALATGGRGGQKEGAQ